MHDCSVAAGDTWLSHNVPIILNSSAFKNGNSVLFLTWDEDDFTTVNKVATVVVTSNHTTVHSAIRYTHYSLVRTIEAAWGVPSMTANGAAATPMSDFFVGLR